MALGDLTERERMTPHWMKKLERVHANGEGGLTFVPSKRKLPGEPYRLSAAQISRWIDFLVRALMLSASFVRTHIVYSMTEQPQFMNLRTTVTYSVHCSTTLFSILSAVQLQQPLRESPALFDHPVALVQLRVTLLISRTSSL